MFPRFILVDSKWHRPVVASVHSTKEPNVRVVFTIFLVSMDEIQISMGSVRTVVHHQHGCAIAPADSGDVDDPCICLLGHSNIIR